MNATRRLRSIAAAAFLVAASASCAGSEPNATPADLCPEPGVSADEVQIGLVYPDSGQMSSIFSVSRAGFDARFGLENARGGVNGRQITYQWRDDEGSPSTNLAVSRELVERADVFAIAQATTAASGGAPYLAENGIPVVGIASETAWASFRNMFAFSYVFTDGDSVDTFGRYVREQGGTRAAIVGIQERDQPGGGLGGQLTASLTSVGIEMDPDSPIEYTPGASSADRFAQQLLAKGIDTLVTTGTTEDLAEILAAARRADVPLKVALSPTAVDAALLAQYGSALAGLTFYAAYAPFELDLDALRAYRQAMAEYAPQLSDPDQTLALAAYINADMVIRGLQEAGPCPTRQAFIDGLRGVEDYTAGGLVPSTNFDEEFGRLKECYAFVRVSDAGDGLEVVNPNYCGSRLAN